MPRALRRTRFENLSHRFKFDSAWSATSTFKPENERFSVEKFGLGRWGSPRNRPGEGGLVIQRYSMGQFDSILWSSRILYCQVLPMVWEIVYITTFRIGVNSSSSCPMFSKFVLFIGVVSLMKYLKCDVGSSFASVTYIIGRIAPNDSPSRGTVVPRMFFSGWRYFWKDLRRGRSKIVRN